MTPMHCRAMIISIWLMLSIAFVISSPVSAASSAGSGSGSGSGWFFSLQDWVDWFRGDLPTRDHAEFSKEEGDICVRLSAAAYCDLRTYATMDMGGPLADFSMTGVIYDDPTDATGFIGVKTSSKSIYVVFRGSQSSKNWKSDIDSSKTPYLSYPDCVNCNVHKGFYTAEQKVIDTVLAQVKSLLAKHPGYDVKITGHSLGAAMAQLAALDLAQNGIEDIEVYSFGQPRTGDHNFASFVATLKVSTWRVTHYKDMVPHLPPALMGFEHSCCEIYEDENGQLKTCDGNEDPTCSDQFFLDLNSGDHNRYLGVEMTCPNQSA